MEPGNWEFAAALICPSGSDPKARLKTVLQKRLSREHVFFAPSARCAIAQLLSLLPQEEVVMPAFNCDVVKSAVEAAGKRIIYVDVARDGVNATSAEFDAAAKPGRILLITHQFGVPTDVGAICELARERGCVTIEDAACCFGAMHCGRPLGTFADFGVFSFENWKRFAAFRGGAIVANQDRLFAPALLAQKPFVGTTLKLPVREIISAFIRNVATTPSIYGRFVLPRLLNAYFEPLPPPPAEGSPPVTKGAAFTREFHPYQARLVLRMLGRMDRIRQHIAGLAAIYRRSFKNSRVTMLLSETCDDGGLLRFPIAIQGQSRAELLRGALKRGIYLETEFEQPLPPSSELAHFPHAVRAGADTVLLPLYSTLSFADASWLAAEINQLAAVASE